jgi:hypothetical protein
MNGIAQGAHFGLGLDARQVRLVAEALAERPYAEVHALMDRLAAWAGAPGGAPFAVGHAELLLILRALGDLPYRRVHVLADALRRQLDAMQCPAREAA